MDIKPQGDRTDKARIRDLLPEIENLIEKGYYIPAIYASLKEKKLIFKSEANFKRQYYALKKERQQPQPNLLKDVSSVPIESSEDDDNEPSIIDGFDLEEQQRVARIVFERNKGGAQT